MLSDKVRLPCVRVTWSMCMCVRVCVYPPVCTIASVFRDACLHRRSIKRWRRAEYLDTVCVYSRTPKDTPDISVCLCSPTSMCYHLLRAVLSRKWSFCFGVIRFADDIPRDVASKGIDNVVDVCPLSSTSYEWRTRHNSNGDVLEKLEALKISLYSCLM